MIRRSGERESGISVLAARRDDVDDISIESCFIKWNKCSGTSFGLKR